MCIFPPLTVVDPLFLASGAADGSVRIWRYDDGSWTAAASLAGHEGALSCVRSLQWTRDGAPGVLLVSAAGDRYVRLWWSSDLATLDQASWTPLQVLEVGAKMQNCVSVAPLLDTGRLVLTMAGVDGQVRIYEGGLDTPPAATSTDVPLFTEQCRLVGHQDWVRSLACLRWGDALLLATASQDRNVRLWRIQPVKDTSTEAAEDDDVLAMLTKYAPRPSFSAAGQRFEATVESVLIGHEDWAQSVCWKPLAPGEAPTLLTASMDRSMMFWRRDAASGLWLAEESLGDVGASHLGYYTARFSPDGLVVAAHGYTGAIHQWSRAGGREGAPWTPVASSTGHYGGITDLTWVTPPAALGPAVAQVPMMLTVSEDQTARLHARTREGRWCEIARPQVHGHDIACVAVLSAPSGTGRFVYASGSEEKVIRIFESPAAFVETVALAAGDAELLARAQREVEAQGSKRAFGASVPALGLSNKAVFVEDLGPDAPRTPDMMGMGEDLNAGGSDFVPQSTPSAVHCPPPEEHLAHNTLWPEIQKVYGHGNDLFCIASDAQGTILASACKAQSAATAEIWIWDTITWTPRQQLAAHTLTVTQLQFSASGRLLLSASRDRSFSVFVGARTEDGGARSYKLAMRVEKAHGRILWGVTANQREDLVATASRDKTVKLWSLDAEGMPKLAVTLPVFASGVTAVQFGPRSLSDGSELLAVGLETGDIFVLRVDPSQPDGKAGAPRVWSSEAAHSSHADSVTRLRWAPDPECGDVWMLASSGMDHALRVFSVLGCE